MGFVGKNAIASVDKHCAIGIVSVPRMTFCIVERMFRRLTENALRHICKILSQVTNKRSSQTDLNMNDASSLIVA